MFKKYYKEANDDIKTNRELIDKIFEEAEKPAKPKRFAKIYKFGMAAAAVLVLAVSVSFLPNIMKNNGQPGTSNTTSPIAHSDVNENNEAVKPANEVDANKKSETTQPVETTEKAETQAEEGVQPIQPIEIETPIDSSANSPVLAMETGDAQVFSIPEGPKSRAISAPDNFESYEVSRSEMIEVTQEEIERVSAGLREHLGDADDITGFQYSFYTVGKVQIENEIVYIGVWRWLVENTHFSKIQDFAVNEDITEMYYCEYTDRDTVQWNTSDNLIAN